MRWLEFAKVVESVIEDEYQLELILDAIQIARMKTNAAIQVAEATKLG